MPLDQLPGEAVLAAGSHTQAECRSISSAGLHLLSRPGYADDIDIDDSQHPSGYISYMPCLGNQLRICFIPFLALQANPSMRQSHDYL